MIRGAWSTRDWRPCWPRSRCGERAYDNPYSKTEATPESLRLGLRGFDARDDLHLLREQGPSCLVDHLGGRAGIARAPRAARLAVAPGAAVRALRLRAF